MGNLRKLATFKPKLTKKITVNRKAKEIITSNPLYGKIGKNYYSDRKSKESVISKLFLNQKKQKSLL